MKRNLWSAAGYAAGGFLFILSLGVMGRVGSDVFLNDTFAFTLDYWETVVAALWPWPIFAAIVAAMMFLQSLFSGRKPD